MRLRRFQTTSNIWYYEMFLTKLNDKYEVCCHGNSFVSVPPSSFKARYVILKAYKKNKRKNKTKQNKTKNKKQQQQQQKKNKKHNI